MIIGGGRSSWVLIESLARALTDPTTFNALHITINPLSLPLAWLIVSTDNPSIDDVALKWPTVMPGKMIERLPSIDQNSVGFGKPVAWHSNDASPCASTACAVGRIMNFGSAILIKMVGGEGERGLKREM